MDDVFVSDADNIVPFQTYKKRKADKFKILSKKTRKGQPIMAGRMEMLLKKIEEAS